MKKVVMYEVQLVRKSSKLYEVDTTFNTTNKAIEGLEKILNIETWHNEKLGFAALDSQNKLCGMHIVSEGTINEAAVYPREIVTRALLNNAASIILFHNHPGGSRIPSTADITVTQKVKQALDTVQISLLDHIILTTEGNTSFANKGLL